MRIRRSAVWGLFPLLGIASAALAGEIVVPNDHTTVQGAVDAALSGDRIVILPGTYAERVRIDGKSLHLIAPVPDSVTVQGISAEHCAPLHLTNLRLLGRNQMAQTILFASSCEFTGTAYAPGLALTDCIGVTLHDCELLGAEGRAGQSGYCDTSTGHVVWPTSGHTGGSALDLVHSNVHLVGGDAEGGQGGSAGSMSCYGQVSYASAGSGGAALRGQSGSAISIFGATLLGGRPGYPTSINVPGHRSPPFDLRNSLISGVDPLAIVQHLLGLAPLTDAAQAMTLQNGDTVANIADYLYLRGLPTHDLHEPDGLSALARPVVLGSVESDRSIWPRGDYDWTTFTLTASTEVLATAETQQTDQLLFHLLQFHAYDQEILGKAVGNRATIQRSLGPGSYLLLIEDWGQDQDAPIPYALSLQEAE